MDDIAATLGIRRRDLNVVSASEAHPWEYPDNRTHLQVAASKGLLHGFIRMKTDQGHILDGASAMTVCSHLLRLSFENIIDVTFCLRAS